MISFSATILVVGASLLCPILAQVNWCDVQNKLCNGQQHIACEPNSFPYSTTCKNVKILAMNSTLKNLILNKHNGYRQEIASGRNTKFPKAKKMSVMAWDDTLQYVAQQHVKHCSFQHDQCRATTQYPQSGQNLYYMATAMQYPNASRAVDEGLTNWFEEYKIASSGIVDKLTMSDSPAFHFSVMVNDNNNRVGCALIQYNFQSGTWTYDAFMLTCNYQYTNMLSTPMYVRGTPCSQCSCSTQYPGLCK